MPILRPYVVCSATIHTPYNGRVVGCTYTIGELFPRRRESAETWLSRARASSLICETAKRNLLCKVTDKK